MEIKSTRLAGVRLIGGVSLALCLGSNPAQGGGGTIKDAPVGDTKNQESAITHAPITGLSRTTESVEHREGSESTSHLSTTLPPNSSVRQPSVQTLPNPVADSATTPSGQIHSPDIKPPHVTSQPQTIEQPATHVQQFRNATQRFEVLVGFNADAVLDRKTGLVWERSPSVKTYLPNDALAHCQGLTLGNRRGWALARIQQLESLVDHTKSNPALPTGHPFKNVKSALYMSADWVSTIPWGGTNNAIFYLDFKTGYSINQPVETPNPNPRLVGFYAWCVRRGTGGSPIH